jgi:hypothetical protein
MERPLSRQRTVALPSQLVCIAMIPGLQHPEVRSEKTHVGYDGCSRTSFNRLCENDMVSDDELEHDRAIE